MSNHLHLVVIPERADSLARIVRRIHGRYAQYYNARRARCGHLWQSRFYSCAMDVTHLERALVYVERNPVRAGMVARAGDYEWSSARAHLNGSDPRLVLDMEWWRSSGLTAWRAALGRKEEGLEQMRQCTYTGCPFGDEPFVAGMRERSGRQWRPGRPKTMAGEALPVASRSNQPSLFG